MNFYDLFKQPNNVVGGLLYKDIYSEQSNSDDEIDFITNKRKLKYNNTPYYLLNNLSDNLSNNLSNNQFNNFKNPVTTYDDYVQLKQFNNYLTYDFNNHIIQNTVPVKLFDISNNRYNMYKNTYGIKKNQFNNMSSIQYKLKTHGQILNLSNLNLLDLVD